jgi:hypothetical protein
MDKIFNQINPVANPEAIVQVGPVRFTVLTSRLIRLEYDPQKRFEDRPSQIFWDRLQPVPKFQKLISEERIILETEFLKLDYQIQERGFFHRYLHITLKETGFTWDYGQQNGSNLGGTVRTLDNIDGSIPLLPGLVSLMGWASVDDNSLVFNNAGWLEERNADPNAKDLYFFGYGKNYTECIKDFQMISGRVPLLPRFALGNWWSRYWAYHQDELLTLMNEFKSHGVPLSVCIIDMDWHITDTGNESPGWTGYTWNKDLFPDPQDFLIKLNHMGLKKALNLHPAAGVYPHEEQYERFAESQGIDPKSRQPIPFRIEDTDFVKAYFELLHHPLEKMGIDFWWIDWQQGTKTNLKGLDPLFWLNHLHFYDLARDGQKRSSIFSRYGGLGSHRYPIGFSGDTYITWDSLKFQPYFTATAANVGYGWWSHDIGGHMGGIEEPELYLRWVQYGVFSPILRLHSTNNPFHERRPWGYDAETETHVTNALRLRHTLIPYLYTAAWINHQEGVLPIRPMYYVHPEDPNAYQVNNQYTFGSELLACPYTTPRDKDTNLSRQIIWLPEGDWFDFFSGQYYQGDGYHAIYGGLDRIPVIAKAGAIVPSSTPQDWGGVELPDKLNIHIFPGANNIFRLYEDDGETQDYLNGVYAITTFKLSYVNKIIFFQIEPAEGQTHLLPETRQYNLIFHTIHKPTFMKIQIEGVQKYCDTVFDQIQNQFTLSNLVLSPKSKLTIHLECDVNFLAQYDQRKKTINQMLEVFRMESYVKQAIHQNLDDFLNNPRWITRYADRMSETHLLALIETWQGKNTQRIPEDPKLAFQSLINNLYHG